MAVFSCWDTTAKILLFIFNCIFWAFGVAILGVGIWIKSDPKLSNFGQAIQVGDGEPVVEIVTWLFIGAGIFVFAVGVVGLIAIIRESKIMMGFYIVCVFIVFAAEASAGIYAGVRKDYIIETIEDQGAIYIKTRYNETGLVSKGFNYVQVTLQCCGVKSFLDYKNSTYIHSLRERIRPNAIMSWACCNPTTTIDEAFKGDGRLTVDADRRDQCMEESIRAGLTYESGLSLNEETAWKDTLKHCETAEAFNCKKGCVDALGDWTEDNLIIMVAIAIAIGASQLILLFLALWFCQSLGQDEK